MCDFFCLSKSRRILFCFTFCWFIVDDLVGWFKLLCFVTKKGNFKIYFVVFVERCWKEVFIFLVGVCLSKEHVVFRLGRSFSLFSSACQLGGGDEVGPFSRGKMGFFSIRIKFSNNSRTQRFVSSFPNDSVCLCKKETFFQKLYFCCAWGKQFSLNPVFDISLFLSLSLFLFSASHHARGLLEMQKDFLWLSCG